MEKAELVKISRKRAAGTLIDLLAVYGILAIVSVVHLIQNLPRTGTVLEAISSNNALLIWFCVSISPIPLIYFRLFCRKFVRSATPGEMYCGVTTITLMSGFTGIFQELSYACLQYFSVLLASVFSILFLVICSCSGLMAMGGIFTELIVYATLPLIVFFLLSFIYAPKTSTDLQSGFDDASAVVVKRLN